VDGESSGSSLDKSSFERLDTKLPPEISLSRHFK